MSVTRVADESVQYWRRKSRRLALTVNAARWLEGVLPGGMAGAFLLGCGVLIRRRLGLESVSMIGWGVVVLAFLLIAAVAWRGMMRRRCTEQEALARLDARLGLKNRLTSAAAGVGDWPLPVATAGSGFRWRWGRVAVFAFGVILFPGAAMWVPLPQGAATAGVAVTPPREWEQVSASLEALKEEELISPEALEALERKLASLMEQPEEEWYRQSSLEAGDSLRMETMQALQALMQNLESARGLAAQQGERLAMGAVPSSQQMTEWSRAMEQLGSGAFPLNEKQLQALKEAAAGMSKEAMEALGERLKEQMAGAGKAMSSMGTLESALEKLAESMGACEGENGSRPGGGREGGGHEPLQIARNAPVIPPGMLEALPQRQNDDYQFGNVLMTTDGEHEVDPTAAIRQQEGGAIAAPGSGGEAVWRDDLMPAEKQFLQQFFK